MKGQLVVRDGNSHLFIARNAKIKYIKVIVETDINSLKDFTSRIKNNHLPNQIHLLFLSINKY